MTNTTRQPGEQRNRKGAEIDNLVESARFPVLNRAVYNVISSSLATRRDVADPIIADHEAQRTQTPQIRPYEAAPVAASVALDATVETPVAPVEVPAQPDMLHEEVTELDPIAEEARWRDLESAVAPQVDAVFTEAGIESFPDALASPLDAARSQVDAAYGSQPGME